MADDPTNKMDAFNLAVVFAPNIICSRDVTGSTQFTENMEPFTDLLKFIIENVSEIFEIPKDVIEESGGVQVGSWWGSSLRCAASCNMVPLICSAFGRLQILGVLAYPYGRPLLQLVRDLRYS